LQSTAQLEFWETYKIEEVGNFLMAANNALKATEKTEVAAAAKPADSISALLTDKDADSTAAKKATTHCWINL
jgi:SecD/SecF fusion protein